MSTGGRAWFTWPTSGDPREPDEAAFKHPVPEGAVPAVPSFALVLVDAQSVDYVLLPNERRRWEREPGVGADAAVAGEEPVTWHEQELNP
jgi:hypothetical protein